MKKHIKNAAGALLLTGAIATACVAFWDAPRDQVRAVLDNWPLLALTAVMAFAGVALVDNRRQVWSHQADQEDLQPSIRPRPDHGER